MEVVKQRENLFRNSLNKWPLPLLFHRLRIIMELAVDIRYQGFLRDVEVLSNFKFRLFEAYSKWHYSSINELEELERNKHLKDKHSKIKKKDDLTKSSKTLSKSEIR